MTELSTPEEVRAYYPEPYELALSKELRQLDHHCRKFISLAPFLVIASGDNEGRLDATPRGGDPGFVLVLDEKTLLIPDHRGNNRVDTMLNITRNPRVGLLFFVPGLLETLRVNGGASILVSDALLEPFAAEGRPPRAAIKVDIEEVFFQCGKALKRSAIWNSEKQLKRSDFPSLGKILAEQSRVPDDPLLNQAIEDDYQTGLY